MQFKTPKIKQRDSKLFYIKFRVHKQVKIFFKKEFITKTLRSQTKSQAKVESEYIYRNYLDILELSKRQLFEDIQIQALVDKYIIEILHQEPKNCIKLYITHLDAFEKFKIYYETEDLSISTKNQTYRALEIFIELIGKNTDVNIVRPFDLIEIKNKISLLANKNFKEYKSLSIEEYIKIKDVPKEKRINDGSLKSYIKHIKKFYVFCYNNNICHINPAVNLSVKVNLDKKDPFTEYEIKSLVNHLNKMDSDIKWLYLSIIYSGMRRAEVFNCTIEEESNIKYFNIHDSKTINGIRKIPLHKNINHLTNNDLIRARLEGINPKNTGNVFAKKIKPLVTVNKRKSLHTIRHWIASKLKANNISDSLIKQLLGHSQQDTLNKIYARSGYPLSELKRIIDLL